MRSMGSDWYKKIWTLGIADQSWTEDTARQVDFIIRVLNLTGNERILDLACGFGRHALEFARRGYSVIGADITPCYVEYGAQQAKKEKLDAEFLLTDLRNLKFQNEFDVALNIADGAIGYLENDAENEKVFDVIARALKPGGRHLMDLMNGAYAQTHFPCQLWDAGSKGLTLSKFEWDQTTKTLIYGQHDYAYGATLEKPEFKAGNPIRLYTIAELEHLLKTRDMTVTASYANFTNRPVNGNEIQMEVCSRKD